MTGTLTWKLLQFFLNFWTSAYQTIDDWRASWSNLRCFSGSDCAEALGCRPQMMSGIKGRYYPFFPGFLVGERQSLRIEGAVS